MLDFWVDEQSITLYAVTPSNMNEAVSTGDPVQALKQNLILYIADHYYYEPTQSQKSNAARSLRAVRSRGGPAYMNRPKNQPRGSGNRYYKNRNCDGGSRPIVTQTDVQIITNE